MAVTSLWSIKGGIGKVLLYTMNEEKTSVVDEIDLDDYSDNDDELSAVLNYTQREVATDNRRLIDGVNCFPATAAKEMNDTKIEAGKTGGVIAYHGYQSFCEGEVSPDIAHEIGMALAEELWGKRFQVVVTTHIDKESHYHNHFVINTVSYVDGKKFHRTNEDYRKMQEVSDRLCREYGLSVIENQNPSVKKNHSEYMAEKNGGFTKNSIIKNDIDDCIALSYDFDEFVYSMKIKGYSFDFSGKYVTITHPNFPRARRLKTLGEDYSEDGIERRIKCNKHNTEIQTKAQDNLQNLFFDGNPNHGYIFSDFQNVFIHFNIGLRRIKYYPDRNRSIQRYLADELLKFDKFAEEQELMLDNDLYTDIDIENFKSDAQKNLDEAIATRQKLRNKLKSAERAENEELQIELKEDIKTLSAGISRYRKEIKISERLLEDKPQVEEIMQELDYEVQLENERKENENNERSRRISRPDR